MGSLKSSRASYVRVDPKTWGRGGGGGLLEDSCEELKIASVLSLIREQLKILGEKVNTLEEQFKKQLFPEEPEEPEAPEDLLTMLPL